MKKSISILLILLTLLPTIGLSIGTHICGGDAKEHKVVFNAQSLQCNMLNETTKTACPMHPVEPMDSSKAMDCCDNVLISIETDEYQNQKTLVLSPAISTVLFTIPVYTLDSQFTAKQELADINLTHRFKSPPPKKTIFVRSEVLLQSFLN